MNVLFSLIEWLNFYRMALIAMFLAVIVIPLQMMYSYPGVFSYLLGITMILVLGIALVKTLNSAE